MSLLLDALKKAADDKEKLSRGESIETSPAVEQIPEPIQSNEQRDEAGSGGVTAPPEELTLQPAEEAMLMEESTVDEAEEELTLEAEYESTLNTKDVVRASSRESLESPAARNRGNGNNSASHPASNNGRTASGSGASKFTVSDDALSLLIDKTNRDVKKSKKTLIIGVAFVSLLILFSGGLYFYTDLQTEIDSIERRHQTAMRAMQLKTSQEKTPDKSAIIRNLVSDVELEEKVQYAKAQLASKKKMSAALPKTKPEVINKVDSAQISIRKTNKSDPVGETLEAGWLAYENGDYAEAKRLYKDALRIEDDNRDAQLGLAAIAVIEKDMTRARNIYLSLLQQDPGDPIATAALTNMRSEKSSLKSDNDYLLSLLKKNPDAPHLNFALGNNFAQLDKWKSAQQYYFKAWQLDAGNPDYIFNLAVSMDQLGKTQQAANFYRDSLDRSVNRQVTFSREAVRKRIDELAGQ